MFDFRLKRAQVALGDGRLDEAFELLKDVSLQEHRTGQKLVTRLSAAFIHRSREHLSAHRLAPALDDCLRAEKLSGNLPEVVQLRTEIAEQIEAERYQSQQRADQLEKAKQQMQNGWLSTGKKILAETDDHQAQCLLKNAEILELEKDSIVGRINQALKLGQVEMAARMYHSSSLKNSMNPQAADLLNRIQQQACQQLQESLGQGDIYVACSFLKQLNSPIIECDAIRLLRQSIDYCHLAAQQIESGNFTAAVLNLKKARTLQPKAKWINESIHQAQTAADAQRDLQSGPLGILENLDVMVVPQAVLPEVPRMPEAAKTKNNSTDESFDLGTQMRFILQIDGVGAYHVLCADQVTIGPISGTRRCDVELVTAPDVQAKQIERIDGDYFIASAKSAHASENSAKQLLHDNQRVELSPRCRFKFSTPNPASSTACLIPSSARFPRADISGVILMDREILIGPERNNHIQSGQFDEAIVLYLQDNQIRCRAQQPVNVDGCALSASQALPMDRRIEIGDVCLSLSTHRT